MAQAMPTYIDESGCTGLVSNGGKPFWRLSAVWFPDDIQVERFRQDVRDLRVRLGTRRDYEFKHAKSPPQRRQAFLEMAARHDFLFAVACIDKTSQHWVRADRYTLHWATVTELAATLRSTYHAHEARCNQALRDRVIVDDNEDGDFLNLVDVQFSAMRSRVERNVPLVGRVRFRKSQPEELLHLADMVCGIVGDRIDGNRELYSIVESKDLDRESVRRNENGPARWSRAVGDFSGWPKLCEAAPCPIKVD